ncbi:hypothetical protein V4B17_05155 [Bartonella sp. B23]
MFTIFKNHVLSCIFTVFILFSVHIAEGSTSILQARFQEGKDFAVLGKNSIMETVDKAVIRDVGRQDRLAFGKIEKVSLFKAFWGSVNIISLISSLITANTPGTIVSIISLLFLIQ